MNQLCDRQLQNQYLPGEINCLCSVGGEITSGEKLVLQTLVLTHHPGFDFTSQPTKLLVFLAGSVIINHIFDFFFFCFVSVD